MNECAARLALNPFLRFGTYPVSWSFDAKELGCGERDCCWDAWCSPRVARLAFRSCIRRLFIPRAPTRRRWGQLVNFSAEAEDPQDGAKKPLSTTKAPVSHEGHSPGKSDAGGGETTESSGNPGLSVRFTCPMHPDVVSDKPGKCPKCGMSLVPKERPK